MPLNSMGEFYKLDQAVRVWQRPGVKLVQGLQGRRLWKACERCKPEFLHKIFEDRYMGLFKNWLGDILHDPPPEGYESGLGGFVERKGLRGRLLDLEAAKQKHGTDQILIACPNGKVISRDPGDRSVYHSCA
jgi:hypothetical protein